MAGEFKAFFGVPILFKGIVKGLLSFFKAFLGVPIIFKSLLRGSYPFKGLHTSRGSYPCCNACLRENDRGIGIGAAVKVV